MFVYFVTGISACGVSVVSLTCTFAALILKPIVELTNFTICKNCENSFEGDFCNRCGQSSHTKRINFHYTLNEIRDLVIGVDKGFFYTLTQLSLRPGNAIRDYIAGKRVQFFKPTAFIILLSVIHIFLEHFQKKEPIIVNFLLGVTSSLKQNTVGKGSNYGLDILEWLINNYSYTALLLIPVFSLASFLAYKKTRINYFENLVLNTYTFGQITFFFILLFPCTYFLTSDLSDYIQIAIILTFTFWTYFQFFNNIRKDSRIINTILTFLLFTIFAAILLMVIAVMAMVVF